MLPHQLKSSSTYSNESCDYYGDFLSIATVNLSTLAVIPEHFMATHWALRFLHFVYAVFMTIAAWMKSRQRWQPEPLTAQRSKIPKHLCLNLVAGNDKLAEETETAFLQCIQRVATWCRASSIETLTVYDYHGILYGCSTDAYRRVFVVNENLEDSCESEVEYPLTPPLSESSGSRSHTPEHATFPAELNVITMVHSSHVRKRRNVAVRRRTKDASSASSNLMLRIVSRASGKPAIVSATRALLQDRVASVSNDTMPSRFQYDLTVPELAVVLEAGLPPPDFMIIHHVGGMKVPHPPIELYSFPPWQISLTEFHRTHPDKDPGFNPSGSESLAPELISETAFCRALDEYAGAQFRKGR